MSGYLQGLETELMAQWRAKSRKSIYRRDPEAWLADVLGLRWHSKQREIAHDIIDNRRVAVKSSNGAGKSRMIGELITWGVATHEIGELLVITSAPGMRQIVETTFAYIAHNYGLAKARGFDIPGQFSEAKIAYQPNWRDKSKTLVIGQKPANQDIIGSFQGIRAIAEKDSKTWVFIDEGGSVHADLFVAAEAVTTGAGDNKIVTIGNPDNIGTYFQRIFEDKKIMVDWIRHTISAFDLPTFTGEIVYDDPETQRQMLTSGMIDPEWVEQKKRAWGEDSARYLSKVKGEFPEGDDFCFFSQTAINTAADTEVEVDHQLELTIGFDVARFGDDDSALYGNRGGRIRRLKFWSKANANESATRAHQMMIDQGAQYLVIDALGLGGPIYDQLAARADRYYTVIGARGSLASPDPTRWANMRAYWYDRFREGMLTGQIDLDLFEDEKLRDELMVVQYDFNEKGAIKIESKKDMAKRGVKSPDYLDAAVYSWVRAREIVEHPLSGMDPGDTIVVDPWDEIESLAGMPI